MALDPHFANVRLLLHCDGSDGSTAIVDSSVANKSPMVNAGVPITTAMSKFGGSSLHFTPFEWLALPAGEEVFLGDFTLEMFVWTNNPAYDPGLIDSNALSSSAAAGNAFRWGLTTSGNLVWEEIVNHGGAIAKLTGAASLNDSQWHHIAASRVSGVLRFFVDGVLDGQVALSTPYSYMGGGVIIGHKGAHYTPSPKWFSGYIDELRITRDVGRYTTNFTPPTEPFPDSGPIHARVLVGRVLGAPVVVATAATAETTGATTARVAANSPLGAPVVVATVGVVGPQSDDVVLLLHFDGPDGSTSIIDSSVRTKTVTVHGSAAITTAQGRFGGSSLYLDGYDSYLSAPSDVDFAFGTGDFTIEMWINASSIGRRKYLIDQQIGSDGAVSAWSIALNPLGWLGWDDYSGTFNTLLARTSVIDGGWHHIAAARKSGTLRLFVDGVLSAQAFRDEDYADPSAISIGTSIAYPNFEDNFSGYIDEVRITKGVARYTTNFSPDIFAPTVSSVNPVVDGIRLLPFIPLLIAGYTATFTTLVAQQERPLAAPVFGTPSVSFSTTHPATSIEAAAAFGTPVAQSIHAAQSLEPVVFGTIDAPLFRAQASSLLGQAAFGQPVASTVHPVQDWYVGIHMGPLVAVSFGSFPVLDSIQLTEFGEPRLGATAHRAMPLHLMPTFGPITISRGTMQC